MARQINSGPSVASKTFAAIAVANAIKTSIATVVGAQNYTGAALNGAIGQGQFGVPQNVSVTTTTFASTYSIGAANPIVFTGTNEQGQVITESLLLTATGGNETIFGTKAFATVTGISVPAQLTTSGAFTFGVGDIVLETPCREIRAGAAGNVKVGYPDMTATDTIPLVVAERVTVAANRIYSTGTTALPVTIFL